MNAEEARDFWKHARIALNAARKNLSIDPNTAVNRAYYAAFYAVSALLALEGRTFRRHSALEAAVHGELVKGGRWPPELGADYRFLRRLRSTGDYDVSTAVSGDDARRAVERAGKILGAVGRERPDLFGDLPTP